MQITRMLAMFAIATLFGVACSDDNSSNPGPEVFKATLNGANERPTPVTTTAAGNATVTLSVSGDTLTWTVNITSAIDSIIAGHIHHAPADSAGPVRVNFSPAPTGAGFTGLATQGTVVLTGDSVQTWLRTGAAYVNIHTKAHTGGEIRGQLVKQ
jgi:PKD repeat protein